jgi:glycerophosphoryl diester phosphodiesterase
MSSYAQTKIIAHQGFWDKLGSAKNSLSSLNNAIDMGAYGSNLGVNMTIDGELVINDSYTYDGANIQKSTFADLASLRLVNGKPLPTLKECIDLIKKQTQTKLIVEIKPHQTSADDTRAAASVVKVIKDCGIADLVEYVSISETVCKELIRLNPKHRVSYLKGDKSPNDLKTEGYWGFAYNGELLRKDHPTWIKEAKKLGLTTNVWIVNDVDGMIYFLDQKVDFITSDDPQLLKGLLLQW